MPTNLTPSQLAAARELCEKATPGIEPCPYCGMDVAAYPLMDGRPESFVACCPLNPTEEEGEHCNYRSAAYSFAQAAINHHNEVSRARSEHRQALSALEAERARAGAYKEALERLVAEADCLLYPAVGGAPACSDATTDRSKWCAWCAASALAANDREAT